MFLKFVICEDYSHYVNASMNLDFKNLDHNNIDLRNSTLKK